MEMASPLIWAEPLDFLQPGLALLRLHRLTMLLRIATSGKFKADTVVCMRLVAIWRQGKCSGSRGLALLELLVVWRMFLTRLIGRPFGIFSSRFLRQPPKRHCRECMSAFEFVLGVCCSLLFLAGSIWVLRGGAESSYDKSLGQKWGIASFYRRSVWVKMQKVLAIIAIGFVLLFWALQLIAFFGRR